ncbi:hypothetical protein QFC22_002042 [Naganishia vaughanmartiniae]|uniref:Uncharacterized protein n=1 Tax=Naganishia vaughanmartiniae TaxID=1424756 RepID=A0ACC2XG72_9TREE|nr:hypothetical protein QFC22_002042 [Naganishia vaughanmartiniae]
MSGTHTTEAEKMVNIPKTSDSTEKKQEKEQTDVAAKRGENTGKCSLGWHITFSSADADCLTL